FSTALVARSVLSPVLPVRPRRRQSRPVAPPSRDPLRDLSPCNHGPVQSPPRSVAAGRWRTAVHSPSLRASQTRITFPPGVALGLRERSVDPPGRRCGQDARLPCGHLLATAQSMDVSVVILNYNTREHLRMCLQALQCVVPTSPEGLDVEVFVVDNASSDGS